MIFVHYFPEAQRKSRRGASQMRIVSRRSLLIFSIILSSPLRSCRPRAPRLRYRACAGAPLRSNHNLVIARPRRFIGAARFCREHCRSRHRTIFRRRQLPEHQPPLQLQTAWLGDNFRKHFLNDIEVHVPAGTLDVYRLRRAAHDDTIAASLGGQRETKLYDVWTFDQLSVAKKN